MDINKIPEIKFVEADVEKVIADAQSCLEDRLGRKLSRADPVLILLKSLLAIIVQQKILINDLARQNLLAYARDSVLDHIGVLTGCERLGAARAICTAEVRLSAARTQVTKIRKATRFNAGDEVNFALDEEVIFLPTETCKVVKATCVETGEQGNGYAPGELYKIVDPQPFLKSITNLTASEGGADVEDNDAYRLRIQQSAEGLSVAGPCRAYEYFTKAASSLIADVAAVSPAPGVVEIYPLLEGGALPDTEMLSIISAYLEDKRPLTDKLEIKQPVISTYDIDLRYYIAKSDQAQVNLIQDAAQKAVQDYIAWQKARLGRDINPTELYYRLRAAGVKRAEISKPVFTPTSNIAVASAQSISATYAGLEDD